MMSLVRAQFGEPSTAKAVLFVLHSACDALSIDDIMINSHTLYHNLTILLESFTAFAVALRAYSVIDGVLSEQSALAHSKASFWIRFV